MIAADIMACKPDRAISLSACSLQRVCLRTLRCHEACEAHRPAKQCCVCCQLGCSTITICQALVTRLCSIIRSKLNVCITRSAPIKMACPAHRAFSLRTSGHTPSNHRLAEKQWSASAMLICHPVLRLQVCEAIQCGPYEHACIICPANLVALYTTRHRIIEIHPERRFTTASISLLFHKAPPVSLALVGAHKRLS